MDKENYTKQLNIRLPMKLWVALTKEAQRRHLQKSDVVRYAILAELAKGLSESELKLQGQVRDYLKEVVNEKASELKVVKRRKSA